MLRALLTVPLLLLNIAIAHSDTQSAKPTERKAVLVTGASTGIGRKITERLAADGYFVYAGARKDADLRALSAIAHVQGVRLDVTSATDIAAAVEVVTKGGRGLHGLVNNAGIATLGPIVGGDEREFDQVMAVNVYGPYRVTRAFAPMIVAQKGRITTIGSLNGIVATGNVGAYSMSKHAVEAFTDSLAQELAPLGVSVSIVEPGAFRTQIAKNANERLGEARAPDLSNLPEPDAVAAAVAHSLFDSKPKRRYMVVSNDREARIAIGRHIERLVQLNEGHAFALSRHALIEMLDQALGQSLSAYRAQ
jgi:NAD(P)-dependent dehydrogenase (short-subunit alcohol dehydrogenase family)